MSTPILGTPDEFAEDLENNLGRANGNVFFRRAGTPDVEDGQIMVRLKKKRYVVLDYSIVPSESDMEIANSNPHVKIPKGAGKTICKSPECNKIGVPVCLYDSEPNEPDSLYLRSGLCFHCQRDLNEKRRTDRKRPSKNVSLSQGGEEKADLIFALGPTPKRIKFKGGGTVEVSADAVIVNGAMDGVKHYGEGYGFQEIGVDLIELARDGFANVERLVNAVSGSASAAVAAVGGPATTEAAATDAVVDPTSETADLLQTSTSPTSNEDISALYQKSFQGLNKSIFLLTQWKASWDSAIAAANETVSDPTLADAVASAAALAASDGQQPNSDNMVSLLLAADKRKDDKESEEVTYEV